MGGAHESKKSCKTSFGTSLSPILVRLWGQSPPGEGLTLNNLVECTRTWYVFSHRPDHLGEEEGGGRREGEREREREREEMGKVGGRH